MSNAMKGKQVIFIHGVYGKTDELFFFLSFFPTVYVSAYNEIFITQVLFTYCPEKQLHIP